MPKVQKMCGAKIVTLSGVGIGTDRNNFINRKLSVVGKKSNDPIQCYKIYEFIKVPKFIVKNRQVFSLSKSNSDIVCLFTIIEVIKENRLLSDGNDKTYVWVEFHKKINLKSFNTSLAVFSCLFNTDTNNVTLKCNKKNSVENHNHCSSVVGGDNDSWWYEKITAEDNCIEEIEVIIPTKIVKKSNKINVINDGNDDNDYNGNDDYGKMLSTIATKSSPIDLKTNVVPHAKSKCNSNSWRKEHASLFSLIHNYHFSNDKHRFIRNTHNNESLMCHLCKTCKKSIYYNNRCNGCENDKICDHHRIIASRVGRKGKMNQTENTKCQKDLLIGGKQRKRLQRQMRIDEDDLNCSNKKNGGGFSKKLLPQRYIQDICSPLVTSIISTTTTQTVPAAHDMELRIDEETDISATILRQNSGKNFNMIIEKNLNDKNFNFINSSNCRSSSYRIGKTFSECLNDIGCIKKHHFQKNSPIPFTNVDDDDDDDDVVNVYSCRINEEKKSKNAPFVKTHFTGKDDDVEQISKTITIRTDSDAGTVTNKKNMIQCLNCVKNRCEKYQQQLNSIMSNNCSKNSNSGHKVQRVNGDEHMFVSRSRIKYTNRIKVDQFDDDQNNNDHDHDILGVAVDGDRKQIDVIKKDQFSVTDIKLLSLTSFKLVTLLRDYLFVLLTRPIMIVNYYPFRFSFLFHITIHCHKFWLLQFTPQAITFISHHIDSGAPASASALLRWMPQITCKNFLIKIELYLKQHHDDKQMQSIGEIKLKKLPNLMKWRKYNNLQKSFNNVKILLSDERQNRITGPSSDLVATDRANLESKRREQIQLQRINNEGAYCGWMPVPEMLALGLLTKILQTDQCLTAFRNLTFKTYNLATHHYHPRNQDSLCADEKRGKSAAQKNRASSSGHSPRKGTTDNGTKSKGAMREAFPSLPFGSPGLDRDSRDKVDRTVEQDNQIITTSSSSSSSSSSSAPSAVVVVVATTTTTSTTATTTSTINTTIINNTATTPQHHHNVINKDEVQGLTDRDSHSTISETADGNVKQTSIGATATNPVPSHPGELEELQSVLHFPEEVALRITDAEYQLFYQVPPIEYFKHVILELQGESGVPHTPPSRSSIRGLQKRFDEVCSWVAHFIVSQATQDERKAAFACLLRAALTCWNIGNFNGAMEITAGLRSIKPKTFWSSIPEKGKLPVLDFLSAALESVEYERALARGLAMPECRVIPCFKAFLSELKDIVSTGPTNITSLSSISDSSHIDVEPVICRNNLYSGGSGGSAGSIVGGTLGASGTGSGYSSATGVGGCGVEAVNRGIQTNLRSPQENRKENFNVNTSGKWSQRKVYISDYNGDDHYFTKIGSGGLINLEQIYRTQAVMDHIDHCHQHHHALCKDSAATLLDYLRLASCSPRQMAATTTYQPEIEELEEDYEVEIGNYNPVQPIVHDHGICMIPISSRHHKIDHHILQILHHGTTAVLWEPETPSDRSCYVFFRLERSCSMVTWHKPSWRRLKTQQDFNMAVNPEELVSPRLTQKQAPSAMDIEGQSPTLDEGYLDLTLVKEITMGSRNHEYDLELLAAGKRFGLTHVECCVSILYGNTLNDNRVLCLLCPPMLCRLWYVGLSWMVRGIKRQQRLADRSMFWLKEQYIQLYFEDGCCCEPLAADAIRVFGGRDWAFSGLMTATGIQPGETVDTLRREASIKFKKKRSVVNLLTQGTSSSGPPSLEMDTPKEIRTKPIDRRKERNGSSDQLWQNVKHLRAGSITYETQLDFVDFIALFRSFSLLARKDLRDLFDQLSVARRSKTTLCSEKSRSAPELCCATRQRKIAQLHVLGLLTRNSSLDLEFTEAKCAQKKIFDAIAASSILANCAGIDTSNTQVITVSTLRKYLEARQMEVKSEDEVKAIIHRHEPDPTLRAEYCLSFEGFARYMMDKDNYAFVNERVIQSTSNMERPLSHYYIASSHNTYLTGHQLKGESSVELYSQVLLTGCRCVELDCWDGDDGSPVIYHGHTFTTKIPFKSVVEAINKSAFVASPYPVILSIENHCSLMQQARMAHIFQSVFGEKLVMKFLFDADYSDEPVLPSPSQLKHRILIKNKKLIIDIPSTISNPALRSNPALKHQASQSGRTSSIISNVSGGSVTEEFSDDEYEDDDDYDNIDEKTLHNIFGSTDEKTSRYSLSSFSNVTPTRRIEMDDKPKKRSSQIARELSDIVIYVQAIKFRGLNPISPHNSVRLQQPPSATSSSASLVTVGSILKGSSGAPSSAPSSSVDSTSAGSETESQHNSFRKLLHANVNHPCYQCSSINEASTKKLCRKHPLAVIAHTQTQLMRTYPAGLRIDSSNFNPTFFWAFGIQMVALNYQTDDPPMHINTAMFEENGCCGFVCKPDVLWDQSHLMYRRFNPLEKEFDGLHSSQIVINVVSGQYVCQSNLFCSTYVEVEMLGIPVDCSKKKTKTIKKNALNPIWNDTFFYKVMFHDLAFLRFSIYDSDSNHLVSQRVIPLKCLRPGYRHVRLRTPTNQPLSMASLFVYSRVEEESLERTSDETDEFMSGQDDSIISYSGDVASGIEPSPFVGANIPLKRRMFFLMVYGVVTDEPYTILKITQESTTQEVIAQALQRANKSTLNVNDYILVEEVRRGWEKKDRDLPSTQRVLDMFEKPLQAQGLWKGEGRFIMKRIGDDPSSRAWLTSIRSVSERRSICESGDGPSSWDDADNFLVCIYNVSPDIPYAILKVPIGSTAQDVLAQSLIKARRLENPSNFVLVEELEYGGGGSSTATNLQQRSLSDDENVYLTQSNWKTIGRFILQEKSQATPSMRRHRLAIDKISRGFSISRAAVLSSTNKPPIQVALSDPTTSRSKIKTEEPGHSQMMGRGIFRAKGNSEKETPTCSPRQRQREVHSEGETLSDDEIKETDLFSTVSRLKKMSIRKLKAWKT